MIALQAYRIDWKNKCLLLRTEGSNTFLEQNKELFIIHGENERKHTKLVKRFKNNKKSESWKGQKVNL